MAVIYLLISFFLLPISANNLDEFYNQLTEKFTPVESSGDFNPLYHIITEKDKYAGGGGLENMKRLNHYLTMNKLVSIASSNINLDSINLTVFHKYDDINVIGKKMPLYFTNEGPQSARLQKKALPKLVSPYASHPDICGPKVQGEERSCVDSLESMMSFVAGLMGTNVKPMTTPAGKWQLYTIEGPAKTIRHQLIGCHKKDYLPFATYGCHYIPRSQVRLVPLIGDDGTKLEAISICHMDTSSWNPHHLLFILLKAKPGPPVCHFLATDDIIWVSK